MANPLPKNPQLPDLGGYTDSGYLAQEAQLRAEITRRYNDVLAQLGYSDPSTGKFIMGSVEQDAYRQRGELTHDLGIAKEGSTNRMREAGTLFSGYRGTDLARSEYPYQNALANLEVDTPKKLGSLYEEAGNIIQDYSVRNALLLADLAARQSEDITKNPTETPGGDGETPGQIPPPEGSAPRTPLPPAQGGASTLPHGIGGTQAIVPGPTTAKKKKPISSLTWIKTKGGRY